MDAGIMAALGELVSAGFIRCARSLRANGVQALDLMTRDANQMSRCECPVRREKWAGILEVGGRPCGCACACAFARACACESKRERGRRRSLSS